jgi:hypothetical protein
VLRRVQPGKYRPSRSLGSAGPAGLDGFRFLADVRPGPSTEWWTVSVADLQETPRALHRDRGRSGRRGVARTPIPTADHSPNRNKLYVRLIGHSRSGKTALVKFPRAVHRLPGARRGQPATADGQPAAPCEVTSSGNEGQKKTPPCRRRLMEAAGIEPASRGTSMTVSTCVADHCSGLCTRVRLPLPRSAGSRVGYRTGV